MKNKIILPVLLMLAVVIVAVAQEYNSRGPTPDEDRWEAGIFDRIATTGTNGTIANAGRQGQAAVGVNSTSLVVTNAAVTANAFIAASLYVSAATTAGDQTNNWVTAVTPAAGSFTVRLRQPPGSNAVVNWFILNY